jgi:hypothetical protein
MATENPTDPHRFKYELDIRGVLQEPIDNAPDGWLDTTITYKRSSFYNGLLRSLTLPMRFTLKAAYLLRKEFYKYGILSRVYLNISWWVQPYIYTLLYNAKLDFGKAKDTETHFEVDAIQNDFSIQVDAYDDVDFAIPLESDALTITLPGLRLKEQPQFIFLPSTDYRSDCYPAIQLVNYQPNSVTASVQNAGFYADSFPGWDTANTNWFYKATVDTIVSIKGHLEGVISSFNPPRNFQVNIYKSGVGLIKTLYQNNLPNGAPVVYSFDFDFSVSMLADERLFFYIERVGSVVSTEGFLFSNGYMDLTYQTISPDSTCKAYRAYDTYTKLLQLMNTTSPNVPNLPVPNQSFLLNTVWKNLIYTCSDSIRPSAKGQTYQAGDTLQIGGEYLVQGGAVTYNSIMYTIGQKFKYKLGHDTFSTIAGGYAQLVTAMPSIIINFKEFFQDIKGLQGGQAAFGQDMGLTCLEDMRWAYRAGVGAIDLGVINDFELTPATELQANSIKVGYKDQQFDKINGNQEVNSTQQYVTDLLSPKKELDLTVTSNAAPYFIEQVRITPVDSAASRSDNDRHIIIIKDTPEMDGSYKPVQMDVLDSYSGIDDVNYYNWYITPKQNLLRGGAYLASIFDKMDGYSIRLASGLKNTDLVTVYQGRRVAEKDPISISDLPAKIFLPYNISVKAGLPVDTATLLEVNPYADIKFNNLDVVYKAFVDEVGVDVGENSAQTFKLLLTPDNNLLNLVH